MPDQNRIDHIVWAVNPDHLDGYAARLAELFDTEFEEFTGNPGLRVLVSWEAGLEIAIATGDPSPAGDAVRAFLEKNGEGLFAVVHRVPDIKAAAERARGLGWPVAAGVSGNPETDKLWKGISRLREQFVGPFANTLLFFGEVDYRD